VKQNVKKLEEVNLSNGLVGIPKVSLLQKLLHLFGIHLIRESSSGVIYCRICLPGCGSGLTVKTYLRPDIYQSTGIREPWCRDAVSSNLTPGLKRVYMFLQI